MKDLNGRNLVTQANNLIEARYTLTKNEQLILCAMISFINPADDEFLTYRTSISQFLNMLDVDKKSGNREMKRVIKRLLSRVIEVETTKGWELYQWVTYAKASPKEDSLLLRFNVELKPYLLDLKGRFTSFKLNEVVGLKSVYSIRIYQLLKDYNGRGKHSFIYPLNDFRQIVLGSGSKKYPIFNNFRVNILEVAKKELDEKSNISFIFETLRTGRTIGRIKFIIIRKKQTAIPKIKPIATKTQQPEVPELIAMTNIGITRKKALAILNEYSTDYINEKFQVLDETKQQKELKNPAGFFIKALKANWKSDTSAKKAKETKEKHQEIKAWQQKMLDEETQKLEESFTTKTRKAFLASLSAEQREQYLIKIKADNQGIANFMDSLDSVYCAAFVMQLMPNMEAEKNKYVAEGLRNKGLI